MSEEEAKKKHHGLHGHPMHDTNHQQFVTVYGNPGRFGGPPHGGTGPISHPGTGPIGAPAPPAPAGPSGGGAGSGALN